MAPERRARFSRAFAGRVQGEAAEGFARFPDVERALSREVTKGRHCERRGTESQRAARATQCARPQYRGVVKSEKGRGTQTWVAGTNGGSGHGFYREPAFRLPAWAVYGFWILANLGWIPGVPKFDPTFVVLAMEASVESLFLSTFILITQNRMMAQADKRADLNLQISLLSEHEVNRSASVGARHRREARDRSSGGAGTGRSREGRSSRRGAGHNRGA